MSILEDKLKQSMQGDDSFLYHYTSLSSACKIFENRSLKLSNLTNTNDPLEFLSTEAGGITVRGDADIRKIFYELTISRKKRENFVRMICFCKDQFCNNEEWKNEKAQDFAANLLHKGWARSRMWAQYADNHNGVCLVFDKKLFKKQFDSLANADIKILQDRPITYTNYLTELESAMSDLTETTGISDDYSNFYLDEKRTQYLFQKCQDYRDENEYRFCLINQKLQSPEEAMFLKYGSSLIAVILGQRFSYTLKLQIPNKIEQYRIYWNYGRPNLIKIA